MNFKYGIIVILFGCIVVVYLFKNNLILFEVKVFLLILLRFLKSCKYCMERLLFFVLFLELLLNVVCIFV